MSNFEYGVLKQYSGHDRDMVIPWGIRIIEPHAFDHCFHLTSIVLPESLEKIRWHAFSNCASLAHITLLSQGAIDFEANWFYQCDNLRIIHAPGVLFSSFKSDSKSLALRGFLENPSVYPEARKAEYIKYMTGQKKRLLTTAIANNDIELFKSYEQFNIKIPSELCDELIDLAAKTQKTEVQAWLMDYVNRTTDRKKEERDKARENEQLLDNPYMAKFMKTEWSWSKLDDGTIRIDKYKGEATDVAIPPFVGNAPVTTVGSFLFNAKRSNGKHAPNNKIQSVTVPEGIKCIEPNAFFKCTALQTISLPETIVAIGAHAFRGCCRLQPLMASAAVCELAYTSNAYANNLKDVTVVISGTLRIPELRNGKWCIHEITRDEMDAFITEFGGVMTTSVSRKTTCLISDDPHSNNAKVRKAKELGTPILFLNVFLSEYFPEGIPE